MRFWSISASWLSPLRTSVGLDIYKIANDIQTWQERRAAEYMTHAPLGSYLRKSVKILIFWKTWKILSESKHSTSNVVEHRI